MSRYGAIISAGALVGLLSGCAQAQTTMAATDAPAEEFAPVYEGIETRLLDDELVEFRLAMRGARSMADVTDYAECAVARFSQIRGFGYARPLRINVRQHFGRWEADAVYTMSKTRPEGSRTMDAGVAAAQCAVNGIPTV